MSESAKFGSDASLLALQFALTPMVRLGVGVEDPLDLAVKCLHDADPRHHRRPPRLHSIKTSIAVCHSGRSDSFFGKLMM